MLVLVHLSCRMEAKQTEILSGENSMLELSGAGTNWAHFLTRGLSDMQTKQLAVG